MFSKSIERLKKYNQHKFTVTPNSNFIALLPLILSPLLGAIVLNFISILFLTYIALSDMSLFSYTGKEKGLAVLNVSFVLAGVLTLASYLYTLLFLYPLSIFRKHNNNSTFVGLAVNLTFIIAMLSGFYLYEQKTYGLLYMFLPVSLIILSLFNTYSYKMLNELIKRDENGKIIWNERKLGFKDLIDLFKK